MNMCCACIVCLYDVPGVWFVGGDCAVCGHNVVVDIVVCVS